MYMQKSRLNSAIIPAILTAIMTLLPLGVVLADQTFYFSDDFTNAYYIDAGQTTSIQTTNGAEYLTAGVLSGSITSGIINGVQGNITAAKIDASVNLPQGTISNFYLSNDNGANWHHVQLGINTFFPDPGNQLRWFASISRSFAGLNPYIESVTVNYTIAGNAGSNPTGSQIFGPSQFSLGGLTDPNGLICSTLALIGLSCTGSSTTAYQPQSHGFNFDIFSGSAKTGTSGIAQTSGGSGTSGVSNNALTGAIATAGTKDLSGNDINLVQVAGKPDIYELVNGQKHAFPTMTIFADYGYTADMVQTISQAQLDKYPRANLLTVHGDTKQFYYLTEGGMVRPVPNDTVLAAYGDRKEDAVQVSQKEFNFYPQNQYVFTEVPLNRDVFQFTNGGKRYLTPMAVARLHIPDEQVAPVIQAELDTYKTLAPVIN